MRDTGGSRVASSYIHILPERSLAQGGIVHRRGATSVTSSASFCYICGFIDMKGGGFPFRSTSEMLCCIQQYSIRKGASRNARFAAVRLTCCFVLEMSLRVGSRRPLFR